MFVTSEGISECRGAWTSWTAVERTIAVTRHDDDEEDISSGGILGVVVAARWTYC